MVVDASVWVSYLVPTDDHHAVSRRCLVRWIQEGQVIVAPNILLAEVGGAVARRTGRADLGTRAVERLLALPHLRLVGVDHALGVRAARLAAEHRLRGVDACYVAVAAALDMPLVSWDQEQLDRTASLVRGETPSQLCT